MSECAESAEGRVLDALCVCARVRVCQGFFVKFLGWFFFQVEKQFSEVNAKQDTLSTD